MAAGISAENARRAVVLGAGFAGYHCLRTLESRLPPDEVELVVVNPADYMLYVPLLPEVAAANLEPRRVAVPLRARLPRTQVMLGNAAGVDLPARTCTVVDVERRKRALAWDRLVTACGSVTRLVSVPGVADYAKGFKSIAEAIYLRDHVLWQPELAELADDPAEQADRAARPATGPVGRNQRRCVAGARAARPLPARGLGVRGRPRRLAGGRRPLPRAGHRAHRKGRTWRRCRTGGRGSPRTGWSTRWPSGSSCSSGSCPRLRCGSPTRIGHVRAHLVDDHQED